MRRWPKFWSIWDAPTRHYCTPSVPTNSIPNCHLFTVHWAGRCKCPAKTAAATKLLTASFDQTAGDAATICALSRCLTAGGKIDQALRMLREQIAAKPNEAQLHLAMGEALWEDQMYDEAEADLRRAIELQPALAAAHLKLSQVLKRKGTSIESLQAARHALHYSPQSIDAILHLAELLRESEEPAEAESLYRQALELRGNSAEIIDLLGATLIDQGRGPEAVQQFDQAIQIRPDYAAAHANRAQALLAAGRFAEGWDEYQWRSQCSQQPRGNRLFTQPPWDGSSLAGRTILIHGEQGLADEILFATCYPDVIAQAVKNCSYVRCSIGAVIPPLVPASTSVRRAAEGREFMEPTSEPVI